MIYIGLNEFKTEVAHAVSVGQTHEEIAQRLNVDIWDVIAADMEAVDTIRKNHRKLRTETDVRKMLKVTFLIMLCLLPMERARCRIPRLRLRTQQEMII